MNTNTVDYVENDNLVIQFEDLTDSCVIFRLRARCSKDFVIYNSETKSSTFALQDAKQIQLTATGLKWMRLLVLGEWKLDRDYKLSLFSIRRYLPFINYHLIKSFFRKHIPVILKVLS
jgi:hypothetical protein